jgi:hypothetical protein
MALWMYNYSEMLVYLDSSPSEARRKDGSDFLIESFDVATHILDDLQAGKHLQDLERQEFKSVA